MILTSASSIRKMVSKQPHHIDITIPKSEMREVPSQCEETFLGDPEDALKQCRLYPNIHIREYTRSFKIHRDRVDPRKDPLGHLIEDSPETLFSLSIGGVTGAITGHIIYDKRKDISKDAQIEAIIAGGLVALLTGSLTYFLSK